MTRLHRRSLLASGGALLLAGPAWADGDVLQVGDQKGGMSSLMKAAGMLDDLPYRIEWHQFAAAAPLLEALNAGAVDLAYAGDAPTTFALAAGVPARIVSLIRGTGAATAILVPKDSPIRAPEDLKGRRIGTNRGSIGHGLLLATAEKYGWSYDDIRMANLLPADAKAAMQSGAVDGWSTWNSFVAQAVLTDTGRVVIDGSGGLLSGMSFLVARDDAISRKRAMLSDYLGRHARARRWAADNVEAYAAALAAEINVSLDVARLTYQFDRARVVPIDDRVVADEQRTSDRFVAGHVIRQGVVAARIFDRSFNAALGSA